MEETNDHLLFLSQGCTDGFGAALVVRLHLQMKRDFVPLVEVEFIPVQYGDEAPDVTGKDVIIVDFSWPREVLLRMETQANSIVVLDHHQSAESELADLDFCIFDTSKSGVVLAFEFFFPDSIIPDLFLYLQDRDLWQWKMPQSREVNAAIRSYPFDFELWTSFLEYGKMKNLVGEGKAIVRYQDQQIRIALPHAELVEIGGHQVPCLNATHLTSEIAHELKLMPTNSYVYLNKASGPGGFPVGISGTGIDVSEI